MIEFSLDKQGNGILKADIFDEIREHFSAENPSARFLRRYNPYISARNYAITPTGRYDVGLTLEILKYLGTKNYPLQGMSQEVARALKPAAMWPNALYSTVPYKLHLDLRDYQQEIVTKCLTFGRGTVVLATAGGKTLTMASLISRICTFYTDKFKCLVIVPDIGLVSQTYQDFVDYKVPFSVSKWTGDYELNTNTNAIVANLGILQSKNSDLNWIKDVDLLVVDEVHKIRKGNKVNDIIKKAKTPYKFGFTGTMPEDKMDQWNIIGKIGPILYQKTSFDLRTENYVANAEILCIKLKHQGSHHFENDNNPYKAELEFCIESKFRNETIAKIAKTADNNILIMVDYIKHGENLYNACKEMCQGKEVYFIQGEVEIEAREKVKQIVESQNNVVIVAISKIFSTGINIKNLHYIVFAGGGKAKIKIVQSIGRGLRLHENKKKLIVVDISDNFKYSLRHAEKRAALYESERIKRTTREISEQS